MEISWKFNIESHRAPIKKAIGSLKNRFGLFQEENKFFRSKEELPAFIRNENIVESHRLFVEDQDTLQCDMNPEGMFALLERVYLWERHEMELNKIEDDKIGEGEEVNQDLEEVDQDLEEVNEDQINGKRKRMVTQQKKKSKRRRISILQTLSVTPQRALGKRIAHRNPRYKFSNFWS